MRQLDPVGKRMDTLSQNSKSKEQKEIGCRVETGVHSARSKTQSLNEAIRDRKSLASLS